MPPPPEEPVPPAPAFGRRAWPAIGIAFVYLLAHVPFLAQSPEDIDSVNFALALHHFNPTDNRPHPPGYPVYVAAGRAALGLIHLVAPSMDPVRADALALAGLSALSGAAALVATWAISVWLAPGATALWSTALLASSPLFWMTGLRPMSDMPGLAAALIAQLLLLRGLSNRRAFVWGALAAGMAIGVRSQAMWLTLPLAACVFVAQRRAGLAWLLTRPLAALVAGGLAWAVPLVMAAGGVPRYLKAMGSQAGDDFAFVEMLWADPTPRHAARALRETLILPWVSSRLAGVIVLMAAVGLVLGFLRNRRAVGLLAVAFGPYAMFHLLFQETLTVRYAMPVLPAVALLCAMALTGLADSGLISQHRASARSYARVRALSGTSTVVAGGALVGAALAVALPGAMAYGRDMHPAFRAIRDMVQAAAHTRPGAVFAHHALGQPLEIEAASTLAALEPPIRYEWLGVADYWLRGGTAQVWFLADPKRTDLALIDPESRRDVTRYRWAVATRPELGGSRPLGADWYRIAPPGWFVGEGWSLSLEAGGVAVASGKGLDHGAIEAYVRSRPERAWMMVGGRDLAAPASPASVLEVAIDGRVVDTWRLDPRKGANFLRTIELADGVPPGSGAYARLTVAAHAEEAGVPTPPVAIRQFDLQSDSGLIYGFGEGWHEEEADDSGRRWRWTSERSALHILPPQSVEIVLRGESPLKYFDAAPTIRLTAGDRTIDSLRPAGDFEWRVRVPLEDVKRSKGVVTLETDRVYLPSAAEGSADTRHLGLRLYEIAVNPTSVGLTPQTGRR